MNKSCKRRNGYMLKGPLRKKGYDWWWHSFTGINEQTKEEKAFYIEFFIMNPSLSKDKIIFGENGKNRPSYCMINVGTWGKNHKQIHQFYKTSDFIADYKKLDVKVNDCVLTEEYTRGSCTCTKEESLDKARLSDEGTMKWELRMEKKITYNVGYGASSFFRRINAFRMFWHAEGIKTLYSGYVILDGIKYIVDKDTSYGYQDKNWGSDFTSPWLWISSNHLYSNITKNRLENSAIELGGGRPVCFKIPLNRKILIGIFYEGKMIEFNFSRMWKYSRVKFSFDEDGRIAHWHVLAKNIKYHIELDLYCKIEEMLLINYEAPDGYKRHNKLFNGGTGYGRMIIYGKKNKIVDDIEIRNAGCEYGEY